MDGAEAVSGAPAAAAERRPAAEWLGLPWYVWALMALAVGMRLAFWALTHRVWEDALIALAPVRNAFTPIGLNHHLGEGNVQSFSSPLSVLVALAAEVVHRGSGLLGLRLAAVATAPLAVLFTYLVCRRLQVGLWPSILAMTYVAANHEQVLFGMAGMETQMATTILLASVYLVLRGDSDVLTGITFGLAMLVRPDFVLWVLPAGVYVAWRSGLLRAAKTAAAALVLYGPWLLFTQLYYGTIIGETIRAKAAVFSPMRLILGPGGLGPLDWLGNALHVYGTDLEMFAPFYDNGGVSSAPLPLALALGISLLVLVLAAQGAWRTRGVPGMLPAIIFVVLFVVYLVFFIGAASFHWYLPPFRAVVIILAAAGLVRLRGAFPRGAPVFAAVLAALFVVATVMLIPIEARVQQIENTVRLGVGQYLGANSTSAQSVVSESSGYVGYYSAAQLHDFPGLTSPLSYRTLSQAAPQDRSLVYLIYKLEPDWIVLRPAEKTYFAQKYPAAAARYTVVRDFKSNVDLHHWGITAEDIDTEFYVLRRG
jgi:hypothetical protein